MKRARYNAEACLTAGRHLADNSQGRFPERACVRDRQHRLRRISQTASPKPRSDTQCHQQQGQSDPTARHIDMESSHHGPDTGQATPTRAFAISLHRKSMEPCALRGAARQIAESSGNFPRKAGCFHGTSRKDCFAHLGLPGGRSIGRCRRSPSRQTLNKVASCDRMAELRR